MRPIRLPIITVILVVLPASHFLRSYAEVRSLDYPTANLNASWINNPVLTPNMADFISGTRIRILLLSGGGGPTFSCGFLCLPPCRGFLFSIFVVITSSSSELSGNLNDSPPVVWSANRDRLVGDNATLHLTQAGDLILRDSDGSFVWSTNTPNTSVSAMTLSPSGNLMLLNRKNETVWSSFDHPTDSLLTGQTLRIGQRLTSNSSAANTTEGRFFLSLQHGGLNAFVNSDPPQFYADILSVKKETSQPPYLTLRNGALEWPNGSVTMVSDPKSWAVQFIRLEFDGHLRVYGIGHKSMTGLSILLDFTNFLLGYCDYPMACGKYGICSNGQCSCPVNPLAGDSAFFRTISWGQVNPGCSPVNPISCQTMETHSLLPLGNVSYFNYIDEKAAALRRTDEESCKQACMKNCSCKAALFKYAGSSLEGDCYLPTELLSLTNTSSMSYNSSAFVKVMITPELVRESQLTSSSNYKSAMIGATILGCLLFTFMVICIAAVCRGNRAYGETEDGDQFDHVRGALVRFSYEELKFATEGFKRKLGQGGFGSVYWGSLSAGKKIAVKTLDGVGQGKKEFMAEVETIGSIHHINLVELIGFCVEKSHRLLVYEYMPNGSLDQWIFGSEEEAALDWETRRKIILHIAKALCYLHEECRHRIAHLDIKPQNILLDGKFNAKLADFGLSKLIDREQSQVMTRMRGTPGYLAPEWLTSIITEKVDVYSFGVVVLEILCGRKNLDPSQPEEAVHLIALLETFELGQLPELFQNNLPLSDSQFNEEEAIRLTRLAIWCLQSNSKRRPSMSTVVKVLEGSADVESKVDFDFFGCPQEF